MASPWSMIASSTCERAEGPQRPGAQQGRDAVEHGEQQASPGLLWRRQLGGDALSTPVFNHVDDQHGHGDRLPLSPRRRVMPTTTSIMTTVTARTGSPAEA